MHNDESRARVLQGDQAIMDLFGMRFVRAENGEAEVRCVVPQALINAAGLAHGAVAFALADQSAAYAVGSLGATGVTTATALNYVRAARAGAELSAIALVQAHSRRTASVRVDVREVADDTLIAHGVFGFQRLANR